MKTRSLERLEEKMTGVEKDSIRYRVLQSAKNFKTSWIDLGQALERAAAGIRALIELG